MKTSDEIREMIKKVWITDEHFHIIEILEALLERIEKQETSLLMVLAKMDSEFDFEKIRKPKWERQP